MLCVRSIWIRFKLTCLNFSNHRTGGLRHDTTSGGTPPWPSKPPWLDTPHPTPPPSLSEAGRTDYLLFLESRGEEGATLLGSSHVVSPSDSMRHPLPPRCHACAHMHPLLLHTPIRAGSSSRPATSAASKSSWMWCSTTRQRAARLGRPSPSGGWEGGERVGQGCLA